MLTQNTKMSFSSPKYSNTEAVVELFISKWKRLENVIVGDIQTPVKKINSWSASCLNVTTGYTLLDESYELKLGGLLSVSFFKTTGTHRGSPHVVYWVGISDGMDVSFFSMQDELDMDSILEMFD